MRLRLSSPFLLFILLSAVFPLGARETTVVLVRHAERESLWDGDSPLSLAGQRRIQHLVPLLEAFKPTALYTSDLARTQQTLAPLAARLGLKPVIRSKGDTPLLPSEMLRDHRGETIVICWHHDLMKKLVRGLGVTGAVPYWSIDTYDWLWVVHVPDQGEATLEQRMQGQSAPAVAPSPQVR